MKRPYYSPFRSLLFWFIYWRMSSLLAHRALCFSKPLFIRSMTNVKVDLFSVCNSKSCLDRNEVSERIMNVVKKFDFVDASKVTFA